MINKKSISLFFLCLVMLLSSCAGSDNQYDASTGVTTTSTETPTISQEEIITPESIKVGSEDFSEMCRILQKTDRTFFAWNYYAFWIDSDGNNVIAEMEPGENVKAITRYRAITTNAESFAEITVGMSIYEVVERVGIPYYRQRFSGVDPIDFRSSDGIEFRMHFNNGCVVSVEQLDNDLDGAIEKLETTVSDIYSLDSFKLHRIYLVENEEKENEHELDNDLRIEGVCGDNGTEWGISITLYDYRNNDERYFDINNYYLVYNKVVTDDHEEIILDMPVEIVIGIAGELEYRANNK